MLAQSLQSSLPSDPSIPVDDASMEQVQVKLVEALHELQKVASAPVRNLPDALRFVQKALTLLGDPEDSSELGPVDWTAFAIRLQERRRLAKLSQSFIAERVGVTATTIRNIESQRRRPGRGLMLKLLAVPELGLRVSDIELDAEHSLGTAWTPTSWFAPKYDPVAMMSDMVEILNGEGGQVEQTLLYFDPQSAADWMATSSSPAYMATYRASVPFAELASHVADCVGNQPLRVNALGCGDGKTEVLLVEHLQRSLPQLHRLELYLLDISHVLLNAAHKHAVETLPEIPVLTVHGNFHELPRYSMLTQPRERCRRLYTLLGLTLVNLREEVRFFRDTLSCCAPETCSSAMSCLRTEHLNTRQRSDGKIRRFSTRSENRTRYGWEGRCGATAEAWLTWNSRSNWTRTARSPAAMAWISSPRPRCTEDYRTDASA